MNFKRICNEEQQKKLEQLFGEMFSSDVQMGQMEEVARVADVLAGVLTIEYFIKLLNFYGYENKTYYFRYWPFWPLQLWQVVRIMGKFPAAKWHGKGHSLCGCQ